MVLPFVWMVMTSLKSAGEVDEQNLVPAKKIVEENGSKVERRFIWENYLDVNRNVRFGQFYWNSIFVASWVTFLHVLTSAMAAYSFARLKWRGRDTLFLMYLGTMMLPVFI